MRAVAVLTGLVLMVAGVGTTDAAETRGVTVKLTPVGGTHTPNSITAEVAADRVVYAGDVLYGERLLAVLDVSDVSNWIAAFDGLRAYKGYTFIPGHGPTSTFGQERQTNPFVADPNYG